jgi:ribosomal protein S18 acetylase RimI-like enzyme
MGDDDLSGILEVDGFRFRKAESADLVSISTLLVSVFTGEQEIPAELIGLSDAAQPQTWCVECGGKIVGTVSLWFENSEAHIGRFAIGCQYRGRHLGTRLLQFALDDIFSQGIDELRLEARAETERIVKRLGGKVVGDPFSFYVGTVTPMIITTSGYTSSDSIQSQQTQL